MVWISTGPPLHWRGYALIVWGSSTKRDFKIQNIYNFFIVKIIILGKLFFVKLLMNRVELILLNKFLDKFR
jgi:hypothetical protein